MTIDKAINEDDLIKAKMKADFIRRYEKAKQEGYEGNLEEFIRKMEASMGLAFGGRTYKPGMISNIKNLLALATDEQQKEADKLWKLELKKMELDPYYIPEIIDPELIETKKTKFKPMKVAFKYGASSQSEEDLIGGHVDDWTNAINKGDLDPSTTFMQYIDMLLGRSGANRGGIISVVPMSS